MGDGFWQCHLVLRTVLSNLLYGPEQVKQCGEEVIRFKWVRPKQDTFIESHPVNLNLSILLVAM